jgi:single-stranded DNA-binding protein
LEFNTYVPANNNWHGVGWVYPIHYEENDGTVRIRRTSNGTIFIKFALKVASYMQKNPYFYIPIIAWQKKAEWLHNHLKYGQVVAITGYLEHTRVELDSYKEGQTRQRDWFNIIASDVKIISDKQYLETFKTKGVPWESNEKDS